MSQQQLMLSNRSGRMGMADFDGSTAYLTRGAGLSGAVDSKLYTMSYWMRADVLSGSPNVNRIFGGFTTLAGGTSRFGVFHGGTGQRLTSLHRNAADVTIMQANSPAILSVDTMYHVLESVDLANVANRQRYVNDVSSVSFTTYTNDTLDFTLADWGVGGNADGGSKWDGGIGDLWVKFGIYTDFSNSANRRLFIDANGKPVNLGATGTAPGLGTPDVFLHLDFGETPANFAQNRGGGGNFTVNGTLGMYPISPSD